MLLREKVTASAIEFDTHNTALNAGIRSDNRKFDEERKMEIYYSTNPGFALVRLGNTMVTARTTAKLIVPNEDSPNRGSHYVKFFAPKSVPKNCVDTFQTYFRMIWRSINALEEDTLCVKNGEKAWLLTSEIVVNDDDGGILDASIAALYVSLSQIRFPSFDPSTGNLFPPSQRRTHKVAFSLKPLSLTVAFINDEILVDPTLMEMQTSQGYALFILTEHGQQVYLDARRPSSANHVEIARQKAVEIISKRRTVIEALVEKYNPGLACVGDSSNFIGQEDNTKEINANSIQRKKQNKENDYEVFEVWHGKTEEAFILDFFKIVEEGRVAEAATDVEVKGNWLHASLSV